jgi:hypothetical protein
MNDTQEKWEPPLWAVIVLALILAVISYGLVPSGEKFFATFWVDLAFSFLIRFMVCLNLLGVILEVYVRY